MQDDRNEAAVALAFHRVAQLAAAMGVRHIHTLPGCWEHRLDDAWWFAVNGHRAAVKTTSGIEVPPFNAYVEFNGWPAGFIDVHGGILAASGVANEDAFIAALDSAIAAAKPAS